MRIPICLAVDHTYSKYMFVLLTSILEQTKQNIDFYILDCGILQSIKQTLLQHIALYPHGTLHFHPIEESLLAPFPKNAVYPPTIYARFFIADLFPHLNKVIYLDIDTCIYRDIAHLYTYDYQGYGLAASSESPPPPLSHIAFHIFNHIQEHKKYLGMEETESYFNSGLLLIDCAYWRKHNILEKCIEYSKIYKDIIYYPDQDILNLIFRNNYHPLPSTIQFFNAISIPEYQSYIENECISSPCSVFHYTDAKPWKFPLYINFGSKLWWKYAESSPYYLDYYMPYIVLQNQTIIDISTKIHKYPLHKRIIPYFKYKLTIGKYRQKYKERYLRMREIQYFHPRSRSYE